MSAIQAATHQDVWPILQKELDLPTPLARIELYFDLDGCSCYYRADSNDEPSMIDLDKGRADTLWNALKRIVELPDLAERFAMVIQSWEPIRFAMDGIVTLRTKEQTT